MLPHDPPSTPEEEKQLLAWALDHARQARTGEVTCAGCGLRTPLRYLFRCYFCSLYFCHACGGTHFGPRRKTTCGTASQ